MCVIRDLCSFYWDIEEGMLLDDLGVNECWKLTRNYMYLYLCVSLYTCFHLLHHFPYSLFISPSRHVDLSSALSFVSTFPSCSSSSFPCVRCSRSRGASEKQGAGRRGGVHLRREWRDARGEDSGSRAGRGAEDWAACRWQLRRKLCKLQISAIKRISDL